MENEQAFPQTLLEALRYFSNPDVCLEFLIPVVWPDGVTCPHCGCKDVHFIATRRIWRCKEKHDGRQFSIKVGTIFAESPIPLDKWLAAIWLLTNCKNGISSCEIARDLGITQKSAWFMMHRVRMAMRTGTFAMMKGECEADETFIGGKARNMHMDVKKRRITGSGPTDKTTVMGILERGDNCKPKDREKHSKVVTIVVPNRRKKTLQKEVKAHVQAGAALYSDALLSYDGLEADYAHQVVDHAVEYVRGKVHTNGLENFWSLTDRTIGGTYVSVEPFHLFRYLDEMSFRFNNRGTRIVPVNDADRFKMVVAGIVGKRLTYKHLTGKDDARQAEPF
jgi:transposase-like protein